MSAERRRPAARALAAPRPRPFSLWRAALLAVSFSLVLVLSMRLDGARPLGPVDLVVPSRLALPAGLECDRWSLLAGVGQERGTAVSIFTDGLAALRACDADERALTLRGTSAGGVAAYAVLEDADGVRFAGYVDGERTLRVRGDLRLAFTNDLATATEDRNLHASLR